MPRIRTIKPDAFLSESLSEVPRGTRWTFAGLWTYADDEGRGRDDARLIKAALYPLDDGTTLDDVRYDLELLAGTGGICRYRAGGRDYFHMPNWDHQRINRPTPSKLPPCPKSDHSGRTHGALSEDVSDSGLDEHIRRSDSVSLNSLRAHGALSEDSREEGKGREQGREQGTRITSASADAEREFVDFWALYPKKRDKGHAAKAFKSARKKASAEDIIDGLRRQLPLLTGADDKFRPYASTWLNGERWADELPAAGTDPDSWMRRRLP